MNNKLDEDFKKLVQIYLTEEEFNHFEALKSIYKSNQPKGKTIWNSDVLRWIIIDHYNLLTIKKNNDKQ